MKEREQEGVRWLEFGLFEGCPITHACLMRHGGCSTGALESLNIGRQVGDLPDNVAKNFAKVSKVLDLPSIAIAKIAHGASVEPIDSEQVPLSDGLMTNKRGLAISVSHADCQAAIFYDPVHHALANVHCGWRSNVVNIYGNAVKAMAATYGSRPENLLVGISPSLGPDAAEFVNFKTELPEAFWRFQVKPNYFDLWAVSAWQLEEAGVLPHHIEIAKIDTFSSPDFFSFRRDRNGGRQATIAVLR